MAAGAASAISWPGPTTGSMRRLATIFLASLPFLAGCGKPFTVESDPPGAEVALYYESETTRDLLRVWWHSPLTPAEIRPGWDCRADVRAVRVMWPDGTLSELRPIEEGTMAYRFEKSKAPPSEKTRGR